MNELNKDQVKHINAWLNRNSEAIAKALKEGDPGKYSTEVGRSYGASVILDELGYDAVYDHDLGKVYLRKREEGV